MMDSHLILSIVIVVISASADGGFIGLRDHRSVTIVNVTGAHTNANGRRSVATHGVTNAVNQVPKEEDNKWHNILPNIVFPDQLAMKKRVTTEKSELLTRFENVSNNNGTTDTAQNVDPTKVATKLNTTYHSSNDVKIEQNITINTHEQTDVNNTRQHDNVDKANKTIIDTEDRVNEVDPKSDEKFDGDVHIRSGEISADSSGLDDRTAIAGDQCPQGKKKLNGICSDED